MLAICPTTSAPTWSGSFEFFLDKSVSSCTACALAKSHHDHKYWWTYSTKNCPSIFESSELETESKLSEPPIQGTKAGRPVWQLQRSNTSDVNGVWWSISPTSFTSKSLVKNLGIDTQMLQINTNHLSMYHASPPKTQGICGVHDTSRHTTVLGHLLYLRGSGQEGIIQISLSVHSMHQIKSTCKSLSNHFR